MECLHKVSGHVQNMSNAMTGFLQVCFSSHCLVYVLVTCLVLLASFFWTAFILVKATVLPSLIIFYVAHEKVFFFTSGHFTKPCNWWFKVVLFVKCC